MKKIQINTLKTITVQELNRVVEELYGRPYNYQQQDGCKDRGIDYVTVPSECGHDFSDEDYENVPSSFHGVSFATWLARDPNENIPGQQYDFEKEYWWIRQFYPCIDMILDDLHKDGLIEEGEYAIIIDW